MRALLTFLMFVLAVPSAAQAPVFIPAANYITPGQDEPGYRAWVAANPQLEVRQTVVSLSSDSEFHCLSLVLICADRI